MAKYRIVPARSQVWIDARSSVHPIHSVADGLEGYVELDPDATGHVDMSREPTGKLSFAVSRLSSGNRMEDRELQKRVDIRKYPSIDGVLVGLASSGSDGTYRVSGDLSFRGVTKRCEDDMTVRFIDAKTVTLAGQHVFDIRDFGMEPPRMLMLKVEPDVVVRIEIFAEKED